MANSEQELAGAISRAVSVAVSSVLSQRAVTPTATTANTGVYLEKVKMNKFVISTNTYNMRACRNKS